MHFYVVSFYVAIFGRDPPRSTKTYCTADSIILCNFSTVIKLFASVIP